MEKRKNIWKQVYLCVCACDVHVCSICVVYVMFRKSVLSILNKCVAGLQFQICCYEKKACPGISLYTSIHHLLFPLAWRYLPQEALCLRHNRKCGTYTCKQAVLLRRMWLPLLTETWSYQTYARTQWRKAVFLWPMWLPLRTEQCSHQTYAHAQWRKAVCLRPMWLPLLTEK